MEKAWRSLWRSVGEGLGKTTEKVWDWRDISTGGYFLSYSRGGGNGQEGSGDPEWCQLARCSGSTWKSIEKTFKSIEKAMKGIETALQKALKTIKNIENH